MSSMLRSLYQNPDKGFFGGETFVYGNMPVFGLAAATKHLSAVEQRETARHHLGGDSEPAVPSPVTQPSN
ncbi:hypothetical protein JYQ62_02620 [Nostoc sp. UHCC 0702]|nr:hypothetical protein JYQ62_02620 [Nostoc sp. UHCC 0702]